MARRTKPLRVVNCAAGTIVLAMLHGCGRADYPTTVGISGRVTLDGGPWPADGEIYFLPIEPAAGLPRRPATAKFSADGNFGAPTSWQEADGIVPGKYKVYVMCWKVPPTSTGPPPLSYVAAKYQSAATSDRTINVVPESADEEFVWDFPSNPAAR